MTDQHDPRGAEENVARLLSSALGQHTRLLPHVRQQVFEHLRAEVRARHASVPFPDLVVALLGGLLACASAGLLLIAAAGRVSPSDHPALLLLSAALVLNLILVPVAGAVIVIRRQREQNG